MLQGHILLQQLKCSPDSTTFGNISILVVGDLIKTSLLLHYFVKVNHNLQNTSRGTYVVDKKDVNNDHEVILVTYNMNDFIMKCTCDFLVLLSM